jgi:hypothetical protein
LRNRDELLQVHETAVGEAIARGEPIPLPLEELDASKIELLVAGL